MIELQCLVFHIDTRTVKSRS